MCLWSLNFDHKTGGVDTIFGHPRCHASWSFDVGHERSQIQLMKVRFKIHYPQAHICRQDKGKQTQQQQCQAQASTSQTPPAIALASTTPPVSSIATAGAADMQSQPATTVKKHETHMVGSFGIFPLLLCVYSHRSPISRPRFPGSARARRGA
jgi:hypothetical protein